MTAPAEAIAELLDYLTPDEREEVEHYTQVLTTGVAMVRYQKDPIGWARDILGIAPETLVWSLNPGYQSHEWDGTENPLQAIADALVAWQDVGVESATGTGKSFFFAVLVLWFLACFEDSLVNTHAPKEDQLTKAIWKEIGKLWPRFQPHFPKAELLSLGIRMRGGLDQSWAANGVSVGIVAGETVASKAQGAHAKYMLTLYEEMPGIPSQVIEAGDNTSTGPFNIRAAIGNPNHQLDTLHKFCTSPGVVHVRISALDHPNIVLRDADFIPGAVSVKSIERRRLKYGEHDPLFQSRVRGISPEQASNALIHLKWLRAAAERFKARQAEGRVPYRVTGKGVDVANSEHGDRACIVDFADNCWVRVEAFQCPDANLLGDQIVREAKAHGLDGRRVGVDAIGVGAGTVNEATRQKYPITAIHAGNPPERRIEKAPDGKMIEWSPDVNQHKNLRGQMYWQAREDLRTGVVDGPEDPELWEELTAVTFEDSNKVVIVEPKADIKDRLGRSPDKADAWVMANWVRARKLVVAEPEEREGQSLGYDYEKGRPRERETGDSIMNQILGHGQGTPTAGRFRVPVRRGR